MQWPGRRSAPSPIDLTQVESTVAASVALAGRMDASTRKALSATTLALVDAKRWEAARGFEMSADMIITLAANAAIPLLGLDLSLYRNVRSVIVQPTTTTSRGPRRGPSSGVITDTRTSIIGEAAANSGPISIAWDAARTDSRHPIRGRNVVIHEFAHKIDMSDGDTDGSPPLRGSQLVRWNEILTDEYERAEGRPSDEVLRPYAWASPAEFFAVATEAFFCTPSDLSDAKPALYAGLRDFYRQDPASWPGPD